MGEQIEGGAGSALAAHSKDAVAKGPAAASRGSGSAVPPSSGRTSPAGDITGEVWETKERATAAQPERHDRTAKGAARQAAGAIDEAVDFVREQPLVSLLAAGVACFMLGLLLGRR